MLPRTPQKLVATSSGNGPSFHASLPCTSSSNVVVSDSEEDGHPHREEPRKVIKIIEISSDESDHESVTLSQNRDMEPRIPKQTPRNLGVYSRRHIIESSDEESDEDSDVVEIIELSDSSVEIVPAPRKKLAAQPLPKSSARQQIPGRPSSPNPHEIDESTIIFDEPRSARTPMRVRTASKKDGDKQSSNTLGGRILSNDNSTSLSRHPPAKVKATPGTPRSNTKKAQLAADLQRRQEYAQKIFDDLNDSVFKRGLPETTKLVWNKRLLTTAGKAKYHRSREGVTTTEIELAEKILDCDERIRNTLSHEMCHLATWIIDKKIDEHHGKLFKSWASRVERKHPHIEVSVKHNYEISYPFEWKCEKCAKIYGRFSKSIKPEECLCGACKEGKLVPQFASRRKLNTPKLSRMAAAKPQDSPRAIQGPSSLADAHGEDSDSEEDVIKLLVQSLATASIIL